MLADAGDFQLCHVTAEAFGLVVTLTTLELECDSLFAAELVDDLGGDNGALYSRSADG